MHAVEKISKTAEFLRERGFDKPEIGIILGTGLGVLADDIEIEQELD